MARDDRESAQNSPAAAHAKSRPVEQTNIPAACSQAASRLRQRCARRRMARRAGGAVGIAAFTTTRACALDGAKVFFGNKHWCGDDKICVKTAAAEAGTSLERIARSSAPVFFKPHASQQTKPAGKEAPKVRALSTERPYGLARRPRKGPPVPPQRQRGRMMFRCLACVHGLAPVLVAFLLRPPFQIGNGGTDAFWRGAPGTFFARARRQDSGCFENQPQRPVRFF